MKRTLSFVVVVITGLMPAGLARASDEEAQLGAGTRALRVWNDLALDAVRTARASDADAARTYAMVNVAIFDAVNGVLARGPLGRAPALVPPAGAPFVASFAAAVDGAAHAVLAAMFPDQAWSFDAELAADQRALGHGLGVDAGLAWGSTVGTKVVAARAGDGSRPVETVPPASGPGIFRAAWTNAQFRNLAPFAIADPGRYVSPPPPALTSAEYAAAFAEVKILGNAAVPDPGA